MLFVDVLTTIAYPWIHSATNLFGPSIYSSVNAFINGHNWVVVSNIVYVHTYLEKIPILTIFFKGVKTTNYTTYR